MENKRNNEMRFILSLIMAFTLSIQAYAAEEKASTYTDEQENLYKPMQQKKKHQPTLTNKKNVRVKKMYFFVVWKKNWLIAKFKWPMLPQLQI